MSYPPPGYSPDRGSIQTSAIWLIVVGILCGGTIPAIFGIIALVQMDKDPQQARQMNKVGWIVFWVLLGVSLLVVLVYFGLSFLIVGMAFIPALVGG
ncbi:MULTISPECIES: hypothetical protein [unclassified Brachybacterium]|uniref:hypothetical protein n=1 Tax=unclassified Brachybacterium TaxID=2623841 RepID=UPI00403368D3